MSPRHEIVIETRLLRMAAKPDREWLMGWLDRSSSATGGGTRVTVACGSAAEVARVAAMLTSRGLPPGAIVTRGAA